MRDADRIRGRRKTRLKLFRAVSAELKIDFSKLTDHLHANCARTTIDAIRRIVIPRAREIMHLLRLCLRQRLDPGSRRDENSRACELSRNYKQSHRRGYSEVATACGCGESLFVKLTFDIGCLRQLRCCALIASSCQNSDAFNDDSSRWTSALCVLCSFCERTHRVGSFSRSSRQMHCDWKAFRHRRSSA